jgi:hypothetical protein
MPQQTPPPPPQSPQSPQAHSSPITSLVTHEEFIGLVRDAVVASQTLPLAQTDRDRLAKTKLVYGSGHRQSARGVTFFAAWQNGATHDFVEVCAFGEENPVQLVCTTLHELGHVLAGPAAGHDVTWRHACERVGLRNARVGQSYTPQDIHPDILGAIAGITPDDGVPAMAGMTRLGKPPAASTPTCTVGYRTKGGKSRGVGSGSRLIRVVCTQCQTKIRVTRGTFRGATCDCGGRFEL